MRSSNDLPRAGRLSPSWFLLPLRKRLLRGSSTMMPTTMQTMPTGRKLKKRSGSKPFSVSASWMTRLGGVPIRVSMPPILLANANGISRRLALILAFCAKLTTMGIIRATVPVLLTKAPMTAVTTISSRNSPNSLSPANVISLPDAFLASPVCTMAPPTTNSPTIIITTELENPERASCGVSIPESKRATRAHKATRSERTLPMAKNTADRARIMSVVIIYCCL